MSKQVQSSLLSEVFELGAAANGEAVAIHFGDTEVSFGELNERVNRVATAMLKSGVSLSDRISLLSKNRPECIEIIGGAAKIGACVNPINYRLKEAEITHIVNDCQPLLWIVSAEFIELAINVVKSLKADITIISIGSTRLGYQPYEKWVSGPAQPEFEYTPAPEQDILLLYTSGTTGLPKGVRINNANYSCFLGTIHEVPGFSYDNRQVVASPMPLFHIAGINVVMAGLAQNCAVLLVQDFQPRRFLRLMEEHNANHVFLAPSMIVALLQIMKENPVELGQLESIAYGASPISSQVLADARHYFGCEFAQLYGMTESTGAGTYLSPEAHDIPGKYRSCGVAWPGLEIRIVETGGRPLEANMCGEIVMRGGFVSPGYLNRPDDTRDTIRDGWLHTGDSGFMDDDGYIYIRDRIKDLIISGGENVSPNEVEDVIAGCPGVVDVAVIGVPSEKWGEEVKAIVVASQPRKLTEYGVIAWAKQKIAGFKVPKSVDFIDELPRNASGKVLKRELRRKYWCQQERKVN